MTLPKGLDLYCGAGGSSQGYVDAGFVMTGVDTLPQKHYPFEFIQADALAYVAAHGHEYDAIFASPPCQCYSRTRTIHPGSTYPDLVELTRAALVATGKPWVIENVPGAPLRWPIMLCGTMFGLPLYRHRLFESSHLLLAPTHGDHPERCPQVGRGASPGGFMIIAGHFANIPQARRCMGIDWMTRSELAQAIPPAYTEHIGRQMVRCL